MYPGGVRAVDELDLVGAPRRDLRPARPERRRQDHHRRACSPRGSSRPAGSAFVGGVDVVAHPALAKQVIGVVPQTNTLDRSLSVWENLYFHGRFFGMSGRGRAGARRPALLEQFRLADRGRRPVLALSGGMAQRLMVARAIMHRPADPVPRRAHRRPRPAEPHRAVGDPRRAARATARRSCSPPTTWRRPTSSATGSRSSTTAASSPSTRPASSSASIGADTIVTVSRRRRPRRARAALLRGERAPARRTPTRVDGTVQLVAVAGRRACCRRWSTAAEQRRLRRDRPLGRRADARDRLHQPHREGPPRMTGHHRCRRAADAAGVEPRTARRSAATPLVAFQRAAACATSPCCARRSRSSCPRTLLQPFLLVFVFTYVFPKIGQGVGGGRTAAERRSPRCSSPASSASRSCSRASSRSPCRWCRSSATRARSRTGCSRRCRSRWSRVEKVDRRARSAVSFAALLVFPIAAVVPATPVHLEINWPVLLTLVPLACSHVRRARAHVRHPVRAPDGADAVRHRRDPAHVPRLRSTTRGSRSSRSAGSQIARARQPARLHVRGLPRRASPPAAHMSLWVVYRRCSASPPCSPGSGSTGSRSASSADAAGGDSLSGPSSRYPPECRGGIKLTFYGVRGSTPCDGHQYERYGGNTSCVALEADGHDPIIFDLGTGLRNYGGH